MDRKIGLQTHEKQELRKIKTSAGTSSANYSYRTSSNNAEQTQNMEEYQFMYNKGVMRSLLRDGKRFDTRRTLQIELEMDKYRSSMKKY